MSDRDIWNNRAPGRLGALSAISQIAAQWPTNAIPGRTREERAAAEAASIIAPNAEAMAAELALERDRSAGQEPLTDGQLSYWTKANHPIAQEYMHAMATEILTLRALERDRLRVAALKARAGYTK